MLKSLCASADPQARTLEALIEGARSSAPSDATNAPTHGLWFVYDIADLEPLATMASSNGIRAHYDKWQWCHLDPVGMRPPKPSFGTGRDFWSTEIELHTADAPTWDAPTPPS
jgi:hypothetical protein